MAGSSSQALIDPNTVQLLLDGAQLSEKQRTAFHRMAQSNTPKHLQLGVQLVTLGWNLFDAAARIGAESSELYTVARQFGLTNFETSQVIDGWRGPAYLATRLLEQRMLDDPDKISTRDLTVAGGVATDKIQAHERQHGAPRKDIMAELLEKIGEDGGKVELTVKANPRAIDVTPRPPAS